MFPEWARSNFGKKIQILNCAGQSKFRKCEFCAGLAKYLAKLGILKWKTVYTKWHGLEVLNGHRPGVDLINYFSVNVLILLCKLDCFIMQAINFAVLWKYLAYKESK